MQICTEEPMCLAGADLIQTKRLCSPCCSNGQGIVGPLGARNGLTVASHSSQHSTLFLPFAVSADRKGTSMELGFDSWGIWSSPRPPGVASCQAGTLTQAGLVPVPMVALT